MQIRSALGREPTIGRRVFIAANAVVVGDVVLEDDVSVWYNVVLRGDIHPVRIGARCNLQDGVVIHVERGIYSTVLGAEVSVGHAAVLHGCTIGRGSLVGIGALVLNNVKIGEHSIIAAGAVVREGSRVPPRSLLAGVPAVVKRQLSEDEVARVARTARNYLEYKSRYLAAGEGLAVPVTKEIRS